jgi:hypothetical protein
LNFSVFFIFNPIYYNFRHKKPPQRYEFYFCFDYYTIWSLNFK